MSIGAPAATPGSARPAAAPKAVRITARTTTLDLNMNTSFSEMVLPDLRRTLPALLVILMMRDASGVIS
jgi:hypothetical protein